MSLIIEREAPWALVTGATGGLGIQFCELLAARGYRLVATARDTARLAALREQIPQVQLALAGDLTDPVCLRNLIRHLKRDQIEPEVLINNAGFGLYGETLKQPTLDEQNLVDLNIQTLTTLTLEFAKLMQRKNKGYILNVASIAAFMPCPYLSVYGASKAYVLQFSEALHEELKKDGVHVTALCPGPVKTNFWSRAGIKAPEKLDFSFTDARDVAECGLRALFKNRAVATYGFVNKVLVFSAQVAPRCLTRFIASEVLKNACKK